MSVNSKILEKIRNDITGKNIKLLIVTKTTSSLLLSYLFTTNRIKPIDLYKNTYLHEIWQSNKWGIVEEEKEKRESDLLIFKKIYKLIKISYEQQ